MRTGIIIFTAGLLALSACGADDASPAVGEQPPASTLAPVEVDLTEPTVPGRPTDYDPSQPQPTLRPPPDGPVANDNLPLTPVGAACWAITEMGLAIARIQARHVAENPESIAPEAAGEAIDPSLIVEDPFVTPIESVDAAIAALREHAPQGEGQPDDVGSFSQRMLETLQAMRPKVAELTPETEGDFFEIFNKHFADMDSWPGADGLIEAAERSPHCQQFAKP